MNARTGATGRRKRAQEGRKLRRFRGRWKVEGCSPGLANFRRLMVSDERKTTSVLCSRAALSMC